MYKFLAKNGQLIAFGLGVVITLLFLINIFSGMSTFSALSDQEQYETGIFNIGIFSAIVLSILCFVAAVLFGVIQSLSDVKGSLKGLAGIAGLAIVFFVVYSMSSAAEPGTALAAAEKIFEVTPGQSKFISGSIVTATVMACLAAAAFLISEVINLFK